MARKKRKSPIKGLQDDMLGYGKMAMVGGITAATAGGMIAHAGPAAAPAVPMMAGFGTIAGFAGPVALASGGRRALDAVRNISVEPKRRKRRKR